MAQPATRAASAIRLIVAARNRWGAHDGTFPVEDVGSCRINACNAAPVRHRAGRLCVGWEASTRKIPVLLANARTSTAGACFGGTPSRAPPLEVPDRPWRAVRDDGSWLWRSRGGDRPVQAGAFWWMSRWRSAIGCRSARSSAMPSLSKRWLVDAFRPIDTLSPRTDPALAVGLEGDHLLARHADIGIGLAAQPLDHETPRPGTWASAAAAFLHVLGPDAVGHPGSPTRGTRVRGGPHGDSAAARQLDRGGGLLVTSTASHSIEVHLRRADGTPRRTGCAGGDRAPADCPPLLAMPAFSTTIFARPGSVASTWSWVT